jgi:hypothetical protein
MWQKHSNHHHNSNNQVIAQKHLLAHPNAAQVVQVADLDLPEDKVAWALVALDKP